jgi:hypothetical protein
MRIDASSADHQPDVPRPLFRLAKDIKVRCQHQEMMASLFSPAVLLYVRSFSASCACNDCCARFQFFDFVAADSLFSLRRMLMSSTAFCVRDPRAPAVRGLDDSLPCHAPLFGHESCCVISASGLLNRRKPLCYAVLAFYALLQSSIPQ